MKTMLSPIDRNNNSSGNESRLSFNRFINGGLFHIGSSSKLSPSRKRLSHGNLKKSHGSCREKINVPQPQQQLNVINSGDIILRKNSLSVPKEKNSSNSTSTGSGIFQKKKEILRNTYAPPVIKLSELNVKTVIPEESEEDLQAELEMDRVTQNLFPSESEKNIVMRRSIVGRSKKVINSAPAGVYWPDLSTLVEMEEKIENNLNNLGDHNWFGSGEQILIKNLEPDDKLLYENSENNYDIPNEDISESEDLVNQEESFYENSKFYSSKKSEKIVSNSSNCAKINVDSSKPLGKTASFCSAFTPVIPDPSKSSKIKEYYDIRKDLFNSKFYSSTRSCSNNDANNNQPNEPKDEDCYDEAWDHRLERKMGNMNLLNDHSTKGEEEVEKILKPLTTPNWSENFKPVTEKDYEHPWDSKDGTVSSKIINRFSSTNSSFLDPMQQSSASSSIGRNHNQQKFKSFHEVVSDRRKPLEEELWYHKSMTRLTSEEALRNEKDGTYLVRPSETSNNDYSLSVKFKNVFHMRISRDQRKSDGKYILGEYSKPYDTIQTMIEHFAHCMLPVKDAESVRLLYPYNRKP